MVEVTVRLHAYSLEAAPVPNMRDRKKIHSQQSRDELFDCIAGIEGTSRQRKILSVVSSTFSGFGLLEMEVRSDISWNRSFACLVFQRKLLQQFLRV